jgi:hypothetical protein
VYTAPYHATESANTAYDHDNIGGGKVTSYYTALDSERLQDSNVTISTLDDWFLHRNMLKGSILQGSDVYRYNWVHIDDFTSRPSHVDAISSVPRENLVAGLPLSVDRRLKFNATTVSANYNWYQFAIVQRFLRVMPGGIIRVDNGIA